jgi:hypothetical protein
VENWRDDPQLGALWIALLDSYTDAAIARLEVDRAAGLLATTSVDIRHLVSGLTWLAERLYYLAAIGVAPFDDEDVLVQVLTETWTATLYGHRLPEPPHTRT